ncbi:hypothetical protein [Pantoea coffeiphila]|uniref:hypothetical protein n=1 Tax=Pantoea coffeiphila TaxID=1465635 RepID=UPI00196038D1|nr:hypothetical protein [Pantoea coffeiphila]MBM7344519.1 hypothetical protein [Pantoea coffeiphila]
MWVFFDRKKIVCGDGIRLLAKAWGKSGKAASKVGPVMDYNVEAAKQFLCRHFAATQVSGNKKATQ